MSLVYTRVNCGGVKRGSVFIELLTGLWWGHWDYSALTLLIPQTRRLLNSTPVQVKRRWAEQTPVSQTADQNPFRPGMFERARSWTLLHVFTWFRSFELNGCESRYDTHNVVWRKRSHVFTNRRQFKSLLNYFRFNSLWNESGQCKYIMSGLQLEFDLR